MIFYVLNKKKKAHRLQLTVLAQAEAKGNYHILCRVQLKRDGTR